MPISTSGGERQFALGKPHIIVEFIGQIADFAARRTDVARIFQVARIGQWPERFRCDQLGKSGDCIERAAQSACDPAQRSGWKPRARSRCGRLGIGGAEQPEISRHDTGPSLGKKRQRVSGPFAFERDGRPHAASVARRQSEELAQGGIFTLCDQIGERCSDFGSGAVATAALETGDQARPVRRDEIEIGDLGPKRCKLANFGLSKRLDIVRPGRKHEAGASLPGDGIEPGID